MNRLIALTLALVLSLVALTGTAHAQTNVGTASCDYTAIKNSLHSTESAGTGNYSSYNSASGTAGRYQFTKYNREYFIRKYPSCNGSSCLDLQAWLHNENCKAVQECTMDALTAENQKLIENNSSCQKLLANGGAWVTGTKTGQTPLSCHVTMSGLIAAVHLGGPKQCAAILANGHGDNDGNTQASYYVCAHKDLPVPGNCTPVPNNAVGISSQTATQAQMDFIAGSGGLVLDGPANPLRDWWLPALALMAEQFTVNMIAQVEAIGMMLDAKHQLETQRLFQLKVAEAHKDYHPSEQMCTFGTFARDLASTDRLAKVTHASVANQLLQREMASGESLASNPDSDNLSRWTQYRERFCDPGDNATGMATICTEPGPENLRNSDINYTQTLDQPLSLAIDLTDDVTTEDEETVFALVDYLFAHNPPKRPPASATDMVKFQTHYMNLRSITAMRGIARNSIANLIALKTATPNSEAGQGNAPYLKALIRELGVAEEEEITKYLGENPSYYAQMEVLTRKIYQNPNFYTNLYDKPANIQRMRASMQAVKLMQDRDIQAALQRREMLLSMILEVRLRDRAEDVYNATDQSMAESTGSQAQTQN
ncbi:MAG: hypothetical protein DI551_00300 [Micavibrio aeruginosavorus]|uniref:Uncharacterized protein n=1 Tax=Micavibrio aeruginosavorus TaxID=349221 RepID=A0A2W5N6L9_9BACT|nr:MAG: hypothetical protein DI551_00300 [Micavibrio aeruginosavorus]